MTLFTEITKKEIKYILIGTAVGFLLQFACAQYLKKHPELLNSNKFNEYDPANPYSPKPEKIDPFSKIWIIRRFRGGALDGLSLVTIINFINEAGPVIGALGGFISFLGVIPKANLVSLLYKNTPQNLPVKSLISLEDTKSATESIAWLCDQNANILFTVLNDESIPFEEKKRTTYGILTQHIDLKTNSARVKFVLCIVAIILALSIANPGGYMILINQLYEAVKAGKISKVVFRAIVRKLRGKAVIVDPDLIDVSSY